MDKKTIMIFGVGELQKSIINRAHLMGLRVVGIDPCTDAICKDDCDVFEVVGGQDYEKTLEICHKHEVDAIATAATDKPLVMMARIADAMGYPFFSIDTAKWSTDKFQMKQRFLIGNVPCAQGRIISSAKEADGLAFPLIVKPRDNSGSRGVKLCRDMEELRVAMQEAKHYSHLDSVLVEEYIEGQEYSIESLHYNGRAEVIQFTEKKTTEFPYNVELGHKQPANLTNSQRQDIQEIIQKIGDCMRFNNCPSHTELKINQRGIFVIETSPRLGGGYITSALTPLSTGINLEDQLLHMALSEPIDTKSGKFDKASAVCFFDLPQGKVTSISEKLNEVNNWPNVVSFEFKLNIGDKVPLLTSGLDRYGQIVVSAGSRKEVDILVDDYQNRINQLITICQ